MLYILLRVFPIKQAKSISLAIKMCHVGKIRRDETRVAEKRGVVGGKSNKRQIL